MRTIKFRAWDKKNKKMLYDALLFSFEVGRNFNNNPNLLFLEFTGLLDKNGKEIYEGDILELFPDSGVSETGKTRARIEWDNRQAMFLIRPQKTFIFNQEFAKTFEVIGNSFENPELLRGEQICNTK